MAGMGWSRMAPLCLGGLMLAATFSGASATVLTFDLNGGVTDRDLPGDYGDNVSALMDGVGTYGGMFGFTPDVVVNYLDAPSTESQIWTTGYSDLTNVLFKEPDGATPLALEFVAAAGKQVVLHGFDLGNFGGALTLPGISVFNENDVELFGSVNFGLGSNVAPHSSFDFIAPLIGQSLRIEIDLTGLGGSSDNVGLDNIAFGQQDAPIVAPVPLPGALPLLAGGLGFMGLMGWRRKRKASAA